MAAAHNAPVPEVVDLRSVRASDLERVLEEEVLTWRSMLSWDFTPSAELVRRFVRIQALSGFALVVRGECIGYGYYVCEERKALVGDLYIMKEWATVQNEDLLLSSILNAVTRMPFVQRVEAQLMMSRGPCERAVPFAKHAQVCPRNFMLLDLRDAESLPAGSAAETHGFPPWEERRHEEAAHVIAASYQGHIDSTINDQYRSVTGAKRFLLNIVQYPGCGSFYPAASYTAHQPGGRMVGLSLASLVASDVGHITQICVTPEAKHRGVGYELLRRSLHSLVAAGCVKTSLTVTANNQEAIALYQRIGFRTMRRFAAYVWEGF